VNGFRSYIRGCARKKAFRTEEEAMNAGRKWKQRPYECPACGKWHLTKKGAE
jgi:hypothetical protein